MKRRMMTIAHRVNGRIMDSILSLAKEMYPRHKYEAYSLKPVYEGEPTKYTVKYNLTDTEFQYLADEYTKRNKDNILIESED